MLWICALALWVVLPAVAFGAAPGASPLRDLFWHAVNLALLVWILIYFARGPVRSFFAERRRAIEADLQSAHQRLEEAQGQLDRGREQLARLDREVDELRERVRAQAEAEAGRIIEQARALMERIRRDSAAAIEQEARRARQELRAQAGALAVEVAGSLLRERIRDADRRRLVDEFVERLEQAPARRGASAGG